MAALLLAGLTACDGSGSPDASSDTPTDCAVSPTLATDAAPSSASGQPENPCDTDLPEGEESTDPTDGSDATGSGSATPAEASLTCLTSKTWHISKPDVESQMEHLMSSRMPAGAAVDSVQIVSGDQTLEVTPDLQATFTDDTVTVIKSHFLAGGTRLNLVTKQTHEGSASGAWKAAGAILVPRGPWSGGIHGTTEVTINGRSGSAPFGASAPDAWADLKLVYDCADGSLTVTVPGKSPFNYLFR